MSKKYSIKIELQSLGGKKWTKKQRLIPATIIIFYSRTPKHNYQRHYYLLPSLFSGSRECNKTGGKKGEDSVITKRKTFLLYLAYI